MEPGDPSSIMAHFNRVRRLPPAQRAAAIQSSNLSDADQRELRSLLRSDESVPVQFLEEPIAGHLDDSIDPDEPPGGDRVLPDSLAGYTVGELIGHGGMGSVYRAVQATTGREVALKVVRSATPTRALLRRFAQEAVVLGRLRHPNIAQVHDAGLHREGRWRIPYLVMEYIQGRSLLVFADERKLSREERVRLLIRICHAVHHAHQQGVIHRDLKPSNILIDESLTSDPTAPQPKVLDFGIARLIDGDNPHHTMATSPGQLLGTLRYMSPEQAAGTPECIDTRSDVYALGVIGYELLTGDLPYDLDQGPLPDALQTIRYGAPQPLDRACGADLGTVLLKTLEKDPARRYASASELADDLQRTLRNEPITARPPSALYQISKLATRHRRIVMAGAAAVLLVVAAAALATSEAFRANRARTAEAEQRALAEARFDDVHGLASTLLFDFDRLLVDVPGSLPARRLVVNKGLEYLGRLEHDVEGRPDLLLDVACGYVELARIQSDEQRPSLGDSLGALASNEKAVEILRALPDLANNPRGSTALFNAAAQCGDVLQMMNRHDEAAEAFTVAFDTVSARLENSSTDRVAGRNRSAVLGRLAGVYHLMGREDEAQRYLQQSRESLAGMLRRAPDDEELRRDLAVSHFFAARTLLARNEPEQAIVELQSYLALVAAPDGATPVGAVSRRDVAIAHQWIGAACQQLGRLDEAEQNFRRELELTQSLVQADPEDYLAFAGQGPALCKLGEIRLAAGDVIGARDWFEQYLEVTRHCAEVDPSNSKVQREHGVALYKLGELDEHRGGDASRSAEERLSALQAAHEWFSQCLEHFRGLKEGGLLWASDAEVFDDIAACQERCQRGMRLIEGPG